MKPRYWSCKVTPLNKEETAEEWHIRRHDDGKEELWNCHEVKDGSGNWLCVPQD